MKICKQGFLNTFVMPSPEGWGLCEWIVSIMAEQRGYSDNEIYTAIQESELSPDVKSLSESQVKNIFDWMVGKTFSGVTIGNAENQKITYTQPI